MLGKTNTPEFGAGSHTFNPVFGPTHNPHDLSKSAGGSSGGAAAALATGMVPIADGSRSRRVAAQPGELLRRGRFRPSAGLVPSWPDADAEDLSVEGPMARSVEDAALLLSVMADRPDLAVVAAQAADLDGLRVAWAPACAATMPSIPSRLGGRCGSTAIRGARVPGGGGVPDLTGAREVFTLRARSFATEIRAAARTARDRMKDTVVWNVELGLALTDEDMARRRRWPWTSTAERPRSSRPSTSSSSRSHRSLPSRSR